MGQRIPQVANDELTLIDTQKSEQRAISVESADWYDWLVDENTRSFAFVNSKGSFTARREQLRHGQYWYAYRHLGKKLRKLYLGKSIDLTRDRLHAAARTLANDGMPSEDGIQGALPPDVTQKSIPDSLLDASLLTTKLSLPPMRPGLILRPRLLALLDSEATHRLLLVSATAGFGKTTLLATWAAHSSQPVAWVSLDNGDNDPTRFWRYLITAIERLYPGVGTAALEMLHELEPSPIESVLTTLLNNVAAKPGASTLILDDYHTITNVSIHTALAFLIDHLSPQLHLVMATRGDPPLPLARLRAQGHMGELRAADLRFTPDETTAFMAAAGTDLSDADISALETRTEGWITGLQLAAIALRGRPDPTRFIAAFTGSHRAIADYLLEEVLLRQPPHLQHFLLSTSILDRLSGPLCDAVLDPASDKQGTQGNQATRINAPRAQEMLETLEQTNLFVVPLDEERRWYRFHQLFAEFLRARLQQLDANRIGVLHQRASEWYEEAGMLAEAIQHAFATPDPHRAARLIEQGVLHGLMQGEITTMKAWMRALSPEQIRASRLLNGVSIMMLLMSGQIDAAEARLRAADRTGDSSPAEIVLHMASAMMALMRGEQAQTISLTENLLSELPHDHMWRGALRLTLGLGYLVSEQYDAALAALMRAREEGRAVGDKRVTTMAAAMSAEIYILQGQLRQASRLLQQTLQYEQHDGKTLSPIAGHLYMPLSLVLREQNTLEAAEQYLHAGITLIQKAGDIPILPALFLILADVCRLRKNSEGAAAALAQAERNIHVYDPSLFLASRLGAERARLALALNDLDGAVQWSRQRGLHPDDVLTSARQSEYLALVRVLLAQARANPSGDCIDTALRLIARMKQAASEGGRYGVMIELDVLESIAWQMRGDITQALRALERALVPAEPEGYVRVFVDQGAPMALLLEELLLRGHVFSSSRNGVSRAYIRMLLEALASEHESNLPAFIAPTPASLEAPALPLEPLSEREQEVLRLLAAGKTHNEIGQALVVSVNTIKTHVKRIYGKLNAHTRRDAIARARVQGLL